MDAVFIAAHGLVVLENVVGGLLLAFHLGNDGPRLVAVGTALHIHGPVHVAVGLMPFQKCRMALLVEVDDESTRVVLLGDAGHVVVLSVVTHATVERGIHLSGRCQLAVHEQFRAVGLSVPVVVAFHIVVAVQRLADALHHLFVLLQVSVSGVVLVRCLGEDSAAAAPRCSPNPFGNPQGSVHRVFPSVEVAEVAFVPIAVYVDDITSPSACIDRIEEGLDESRSVPVVTAVPRRWRTETHTGCHEALPVVQYGGQVFRMVISTVAGLVAGLHVGRESGSTAARSRGIAAVYLVGHHFKVGMHVFTSAPGVGAGHVERVAGSEVARCSCQLWLARIVPFEHAIRRYAPVEDSG